MCVCVCQKRTPRFRVPKLQFENRAVMNLPSFWKPAGFQHFPAKLMRLLCAACASFFPAGVGWRRLEERKPLTRGDQHCLKLNPSLSEANDSQERWRNIYGLHTYTLGTEFSAPRRVKNSRSGGFEGPRMQTIKCYRRCERTRGN